MYNGSNIITLSVNHPGTLSANLFPHSLNCLGVIREYKKAHNYSTHITCYDVCGLENRKWRYDVI